MKTLKIVIVSKKIIICVIILLLIIQAGLTYLVMHYTNTPAIEFIDTQSNIIVIDAGHGGVDGGTNREGLLEKDINLAVALNLSRIMSEKGYTVVMTRDEDVSLDYLNKSSHSRHKRDLNARVNIINSSNAQLFVSIHVNSSDNPKVNGSIVYYKQKFLQNNNLAYFIQLALNGLTLNSISRSAHIPQIGDYYLLNNSDIPGVIIETAFISNAKEKALLGQDDFRKQLSQAIADGIEAYLKNEK